jgi:3-carboxy-cis,cis-muconate cycloisomerase
VAALLQVEQALAAVEEELGVVPEGTARSIATAVTTAAVDPGTLRDRAAAAGTPVEPLVRALGDTADDVARWLHFGATTQDIVDTALALIVRRAGMVLATPLAAASASLADLADRHRHTVMAGRSLLQQGAPTSFGLKAAGWLVALVDAGERCRAAAEAIPAQLGGAVGTLSAFGPGGPAVLDAYAARLALPAPVLPWHAHRGPIAALGAALGGLAGTVGKIAGDLILLGQTEVGEAHERTEAGRGVSSAMPAKHNPVAAVAARAAAIRAAPVAQLLAVALDHEHERAAGAWQAEAPAVCDLLGLVALAVEGLADALDGLVVDEDRMRANLDPTVAAQHVAEVLATTVGRRQAHEALAAAAARARDGQPLRAALLADDAVRTHLGEDGLDAALDPAAGLAAVDALVDRALARWRASS